MDAYLTKSPSADVITPEQITIENRLDILDERFRKKYLARLSSEMPIAPLGDIPGLEFIRHTTLETGGDRCDFYVRVQRRETWH